MKTRIDFSGKVHNNDGEESKIEDDSMDHQQSLRSAELLSLLQDASRILQQRQSERNLSSDEIKASLDIYQQLQRVLSLSTRTGDWSGAVLSTLKRTRQGFHETYLALEKEFDDAAQSQTNLLKETPAAIRPLGRESLSEVSEFFILDNSLRETTVGAPRGHTLEEKHQIVDRIAESGLDEVILGAYGSKISVDSQIAVRWRDKGQSFDKTWGFSSLYDFEGFDQEPIWDDLESFYKRTESGEINLLDGDDGKPIEFFSPPSDVRQTYSEEERNLFKRAYKDFLPGSFEGKSPDKILKDSESMSGRIPMGLLMMCGFGIKNAILELDSSLENFDFESYDLLERCKFLQSWATKNLEKRGPDGQEHPRVLFNFTDFTNWKRSSSGLEEALYLIHELSSLSENERPFGYMMEDPSSWLFPDETSRLIRMMRLVMNRAGFPRGKLLVHIHMHFGLAEANVLSTLANGADGVWAAMCTPGGQVGHACSTMTAVNLFRAGFTSVADKYDLEKMAKAARAIHSISTREKCPSHQEVYGEDAFDVPFLMTAVPSCRYSLALLQQRMGIERRSIRLNEIVPSSAVRRAMEDHFGPPEVSGWDPSFCPKMHSAIQNYLLTGLSRDYNTAAGLGNLYALVSRKEMPPKMIWTVMINSDIKDYHPTILEFISRWNRLCAKFEGETTPQTGSAAGDSCMCLNLDITVEPTKIELPFEFFFKDVLQNHVLAPLPKIFKSYIFKAVVDEERKLQGTRKPKVNFFDQIVRLKLFIEEAESLGVLPLVDDFVLRKNHDFFFGEDHEWLREIRGSRPKVIKNVMRAHMDYYPRFYKDHGNHGMLRCLKAAAKRIADNQAIMDDLQDLRSGDSMQVIESVAFERDAVMNIAQTNNALEGLEKSSQRHTESKDIKISDARIRRSLLLAGRRSGTGYPSTDFNGPGRTSTLFHMMNDDKADEFLSTMDRIMDDLDNQQINEIIESVEMEEVSISKTKKRKKFFFKRFLKKKETK